MKEHVDSAAREVVRGQGDRNESQGCVESQRARGPRMKAMMQTTMTLKAAMMATMTKRITIGTLAWNMTRASSAAILDHASVSLRMKSLAPAHARFSTSKPSIYVPRPFPYQNTSVSVPVHAHISTRLCIRIRQGKWLCIAMGKKRETWMETKEIETIK